jgi:G3E family GTPase
LKKEDLRLKASRIMEVILVSGFLGAGKTTLVSHLLRSRPEGSGKLALIVNELGEVGVDGSLLSGQNVDMVELTSGCICCTIQTDFLRAVQEIHNRIDPDFLVVEATGVAQPGDMFDMLFQPPLSDFAGLKSLVTVVDADFFKAREILGTFYENQIRFADLLILNKIDLVGAPRLGEIQALLGRINTHAPILSTQNCVVDPSLLFQANSHDKEPRSNRVEGHHNHHAWGFQAFSFQDRGIMDRERLERFLESLPETLFRLKGWIQFPEDSAFLDFTAGRYRMEPSDRPRTTALTFVGRDCDEKELIAALRGCMIKEPPHS